MHHTASLRTSSGHIMVKMIESRAPPEPPAATTCSIPSFLSINPSVSALICDSDRPYSWMSDFPQLGRSHNNTRLPPSARA